jgi:hypothetical protein
VDGIVSVIRPIVDRQPYSRIRIPVKPASRNQCFDEHVFVAAVVDRECDVFVGEFPKVSARSLTPCQQPYGLKQADTLPLRDVQTPAQPFKFCVPDALALHDCPLIRMCVPADAW